MPGLLGFVFKNREKASFFSKRFLKLIAKRAYYFPMLCRLLFSRFVIKAGGGKLGERTVFMNVAINGKSKNLLVGSDSYFGYKVDLSTHGLIEVGSKVVINDNVVILTATHDLADAQWKIIKKNVRIGDNAWIATNSLIMPGVNIGEGAVVGAGSVVREDIPSGGIVIGNPARIVGYRKASSYDYNPIVFVSPIEAWVGKNSKLFK